MKKHSQPHPIIPPIHRSTNPVPPPPAAPHAPHAPRAPHSALTESQQAILADALLQGLADHEAQKFVADHFQIDVPLSFFPVFFTTVCLPRLQARQAQLLAAARALATQTDQDRQILDQLVLDALTRKTFELSLSPQANPSDLKALFHLVLRARALKLQEARLDLERQKLQILQTQAQAAHPPDTPRPDLTAPLTDAERRAIVFKVDEILGLNTPGLHPPSSWDPPPNSPTDTSGSPPPTSLSSPGPPPTPSL